MKIYIVTSGCYSDYSILRVFTNEEKANEYVAMLKKEKYSEVNGVEIYETDDDKTFSSKPFLEAKYIISNQNKETYEFEIDFKNTLDNPDLTDYPFNYTNYYIAILTKEEVISVHRLISNENYDEEYLKNKYLKVCRDLYAQIKHLKSQGYNEKQISELINGL